MKLGLAEWLAAGRSDPIKSVDTVGAGRQRRGRSAWSVLAVVTLSHFTQHLYAGIAVLYPAIMATLGISYTELGIAVGASSVTSGLLQFGFSLAARYAPKRLLLGAGNLLMSLGTFMMGLTRGFYQFVAANLLGGAGTAPQHPVGVSIITDRYERGTVGGALGVHYGLAYVGNIVSPLLLTAIAVAYGWREALYVLAIPPAFTGVLLMLYLAGESPETEKRPRAGLLGEVRGSLRVKGAWAVMGAQMLLAGSTGMGSMVTYMPLFLTNELHMGTVETGAIYSLAMFAGVLGTLLLGHYSDRIGHLNAAMISAVVTSTATLLLILYRSASILLVPHLFVMGLSGFAITSLLQAHLSAVAEPGQREILFGVFFTAGFGFSSVWSIIIGVLRDTYGSFAPAWTLMAVLGLTATLILWRSNP
ncbi:MAG: MFS transporter [Candidatus Bathyarchaeia archaeon]